MGKRIRRVFILTLALLAIASLAHGQVSSGTLAGLVTGPTGAVIGGAEVQAKVASICVTVSLPSCHASYQKCGTVTPPPARQSPPIPPPSGSSCGST